MWLRGHSGRWSAGGGSTLELPSHSGHIVVLQQWSSSPAQDVTWKRILLSTIRRHHPGKSLLFKAKQPLQPGVLLFVCSPVEMLLSVSMGPEDEHLTRSEQLFDQLLYFLISPVSLWTLDRAVKVQSSVSGHQCHPDRELPGTFSSMHRYSDIPSFDRHG